MPLRYAGDKVRSAAIAKLKAMATIATVFDIDHEVTLSWDSFRSKLSPEVKAKAQERVQLALDKPGEMIESQGTGSAIRTVKKFIFQKRKSAVVALVKRSKQAGNTSSGQEASRAEAPSNPQISEVVWRIPSRGDAKLHFMDADVPWCQRKQAKKTRMRTMSAEGVGIVTALATAHSFCATCRRIFSVTYDYEFVP